MTEGRAMPSGLIGNRIAGMRAQASKIGQARVGVVLRG